ncbi:hypothetical protein ACP56K_003432 [Escherichia coli]
MSKIHNPVVLINKTDNNVRVVAVTDGSQNYQDARLMASMELDITGDGADTWSRVGYYMAAEIEALRQRIVELETKANQQTRISDKGLTRLIADANRALDMGPVADSEWWQLLRQSLLELQERRKTGVIPVTPGVKEHQVRELVNKLRDVAIKYHGTQQLRAHIAKTVIRSGLVSGGIIR